jgi:hypothetical protein
MNRLAKTVPSLDRKSEPKQTENPADYRSFAQIPTVSTSFCHHVANTVGNAVPRTGQLVTVNALAPGKVAKPYALG